MAKAAIPKKATLHVSLDSMLTERVRLVCERMAVPVSHFASLELSREVARFEAEFPVPASPGASATRSARP